MFGLSQYLTVGLKKLAATREDVLVQMRDPNRMAEVLPVVDYSLEQLVKQ